MPSWRRNFAYAVSFTVRTYAIPAMTRQYEKNDQAPVAHVVSVRCDALRARRVTLQDKIIQAQRWCKWGGVHLGQGSV